MPKKIKFESFKYRFLIAAESISKKVASHSLSDWNRFLLGLEFDYDKGKARISWQGQYPGSAEFSLDEPRLYIRGDNMEHRARQQQAGMQAKEDPIKLANEAYFRAAVERVASITGFQLKDSQDSAEVDRHTKERSFHDAWAESEDPNQIDVRQANEACTAPEMRFITRRLGDIRGKRLLDVGCGLGEASVYFALQGAEVTSADLSPGMLTACSRLATANGVKVTPHLAAAEDMQLPPDAQFDIIYAGNLLHHVDIEQTIKRLKPHLAKDGLLVTWDPIAYNPVINVYRKIATEVRTPDEHPLTWKDLKSFEKHFSHVQRKYFWLTSLIIFVLMAAVQRKNPNQVRFWKAVVQDSHKWKWIYSPLEVLDKILLAMIPPLRLLCWNVVIVSKA